jgi:hypothetical protein
MQQRNTISQGGAFPATFCWDPAAQEDSGRFQRIRGQGSLCGQFGEQSGIVVAE